MFVSVFLILITTIIDVAIKFVYDVVLRAGILHHSWEGVGGRPSREGLGSVSGYEFKSQQVYILHLDLETTCIRVLHREHNTFIRSFRVWNTRVNEFRFTKKV